MTPGVACPSCGGPAAERVGPIPAATMFAGARLAEPLPGGELLRCPGCRLGFRWPMPDKARLDALYAAASGQAWDYEDYRRDDWDLARAWTLAQAPLSRVLDVGCYDGRWLASLPAAVEKHGIEIARSVHAQLRARGIRLVSEDLATLPPPAAPYDVVAAFDVIEHVHDAAGFVRRLAALVRPGGSIIIGSGNLDAPSWRFMGAGYWYCTIGEHLSFIGEQWAERVARTEGLTLARLARYRREHGAVRRAADLMKNACYRVSPALLGRVRSLARGGVQPGPGSAEFRQPPSWLTARDHLLVEFRTPATR